MVALATLSLTLTDTVGFTEGRGINNSRTVAGDYAISDGTLHWFFLSGGNFTEYDVPGAVQTNLLSINEPGDFTGGFDPDGSGVFQAVPWAVAVLHNVVEHPVQS